jgi:hypothetical protein
MIIFKNQDAECRTWIREHADCLVVNVPTLMLHYPNCEHISDLRTKSPKACASGAGARNELRDWARREKGKTLLNCEGCEA